MTFRDEFSEESPIVSDFTILRTAVHVILSLFWSYFSPTCFLFLFLGARSCFEDAKELLGKENKKYLALLLIRKVLCTVTLKSIFQSFLECFI